MTLWTEDLSSLKFQGELPSQWLFMMEEDLSVPQSFCWSHRCAAGEVCVSACGHEAGGYSLPFPIPPVPPQPLPQLLTLDCFVMEHNLELVQTLILFT